MTAARVIQRGWWAQLRTGLAPAQVRAVLAVVACAIAGALAGLAYGDTAVDIGFALVIAWLIRDRWTLLDRCDQATDDADRALGAVTNLTDDTPTGRHARRNAA